MRLVGCAAGGGARPGRALHALVLLGALAAPAAVAAPAAACSCWGDAFTPGSATLLAPASDAAAPLDTHVWVAVERAQGDPPDAAPASRDPARGRFRLREGEAPGGREIAIRRHQVTPRLIELAPAAALSAGTRYVVTLEEEGGRPTPIGTFRTGTAAGGGAPPSVVPSGQVREDRGNSCSIGGFGAVVSLKPPPPAGALVALWQAASGTPDFTLPPDRVMVATDGTLDFEPGSHCAPGDALPGLGVGCGVTLGLRLVDLSGRVGPAAELRLWGATATDATSDAQREAEQEGAHGRLAGQLAEAEGAAARVGAWPGWWRLALTTRLGFVALGAGVLGALALRAAAPRRAGAGPGWPRRLAAVASGLLLVLALGLLGSAGWRAQAGRRAAIARVAELRGALADHDRRGASAGRCPQPRVPVPAPDGEVARRWPDEPNPPPPPVGPDRRRPCQPGDPLCAEL